MLNKLHREQEAPHAKCVALLVEFIRAVRAQKECIMCGVKLERHGFAAHRPGCATRRADIHIRSIKQSSQPSAQDAPLHRRN
jgi:endogenous inhibitor of DNA gyrase (YacG/DUF329 family)